MRAFSFQALEMIRLTGARGPRSRRGVVGPEGAPRRVRRTIARAVVLTAATAVLLFALATPAIAGIR